MDGIVRVEASRRCRGFSLVETMISASMVLSALLVIVSSVVRAKVARVEAERAVVASTALDQAVAVLEGLGITDAYQDYAPNQKGGAYPAAGSGPGTPILADGLQDAAAPSKAAQVSIQFFTNETVKRADFGLPRDLDGDGFVKNVDTSTLCADGLLQARILPYLLTLTYRGPSGGSITATRRGVLTYVR